MIAWLRWFYYSLPIQLMVIQLRRYPVLLALWGVVLGVVSGRLDTTFGTAYLFLEPEYLGEESLLSLLIVGAALGVMLFAYVNTLYINESYRLPFLILQRYPFFTFSMNAFPVPGLMLGVYFYEFSRFHAHQPGATTSGVWTQAGALLLGIVVVFLLFWAHFYTARRRLLHAIGDKIEHEIDRATRLNNRKVLRERVREALLMQYEVSFYVVFPLRLASVTTRPQMEVRALMRVLNRNHGNLLVVQFALLALVITLGTLDEKPVFQLPAAASVMFLFSLIMMIAGALAFWFRRMGILLLLVVGLLGWGYTHLGVLQKRPMAPGLDYAAAPAVYTQQVLDSLGSEAIVQKDHAVHIQMLTRWKTQWHRRHGYSHRPTAIFVCTSGGGLRSALWTFSVMERLDSLTNGEFWEEVRLITGASGGMIGATYYREVHPTLPYHRQPLVQPVSHPLGDASARARANLGKDLLNRTIFRYFSDLLQPRRDVKLGTHFYDNERGIAFDRQLMTNLPELRNRRLCDYTLPEQQAEIPPIIYAPTVLNQGRQLYVSALPVSFLARRSGVCGTYVSKAAGIEFRRFFARQQADSLFLATALRMNATFPFVLPEVSLPSRPAMVVMDAGAMDNYGVSTAVEYLSEFRDWFSANTERVVFVLIRDNERIDPILSDANVGGGYKSMGEAKDMYNDRMLEAAEQWYPGNLQVIGFEYPKETTRQAVSLSFHLTRREKVSVLDSLDARRNQIGFDWVRKEW